MWSFVLKSSKDCAMLSMLHPLASAICRQAVLNVSPFCMESKTLTPRNWWILEVKDLKIFDSFLILKINFFESDSKTSPFFFWSARNILIISSHSKALSALITLTLNIWTAKVLWNSARGLNNFSDARFICRNSSNESVNLISQRLIELRYDLNYFGQSND